MALKCGRTPLAAVRTFGCRQNESDGEHLAGWLETMGFVFTDDFRLADLILINTCAVREHAEDRVFALLGTLKEIKAGNPGLIIVLCGCMAQQEGVRRRIARSFPFVSIVFGPPSINRFPELLYGYITGGGAVAGTDTDGCNVAEGTPAVRRSEYAASLPIMSGCDNFCTYCVVPYVRGREVSRRPEDILKEAETLLAAGVKEITLLGQNVNSYGKKDGFGADFADLLAMLNALPGDFRIEFMTSNPRDCTDKLLETIRDCDKVGKHLHLPVQSGSDAILRRMNRRYDRAGYLRLVEKARATVPGIVLTTDIIVGFPGENYGNFLETLSLIREVGFYSLFTFIYSPRENTPAAGYPDPVTREEKGKWFNMLLAAQEEIAAGRNRRFEGSTLRVLCEKYDPASRTAYGHADNSAPVRFVSDRDLTGRFVNVKITDAGKNMAGVPAE